MGDLSVCRDHVLLVELRLALTLVVKRPYSPEKAFELARAACDWVEK